MKLSKDLAMQPIVIGVSVFVIGLVIGTLVVAPYRQRQKAKKVVAKTAETLADKKAA